MKVAEIVEERIALPSCGLTLRGVLAYPARAEPLRAVLICSPHPHFAGDMHNNIVEALARDLARDSVSLRFDYRGVGESEIGLTSGLSTFDYWQEVEERKDYTDAIADVRAAARFLAHETPNLPMVVVGYSFGAVLALCYGRSDDAVRAMVGICPPWTRMTVDFLSDCLKPVLLLGAQSDFLYSADEVARVKSLVSPNVQIRILRSGDHFFRGQERTVCLYVRRHIRGALCDSCGGGL